LLIASDSFVDGLIRAARRQGRYGQRNATLILLISVAERLTQRH